MKPIVHYGEHFGVSVGRSTTLSDVRDHPNPDIKGDLVRTSTVLKFDYDTGRIETLNTVYIPK